MKNSIRTLKAASLLGLVAGFSAGAQVLPPNPDPTCVAPPQTFASWFVSGHPGLNQPVGPADSLTLNTSNNCNFYLWSEQMFLWLTSPVSGPYQGNRVLDSQVFYQLNNGNLVEQVPFAPLNLGVRAAQVGPDGLPVILDEKGHLREFVTAPAKAKIAAVRPGVEGKAEFLDSAGKKLALPPKITADMLPQALGRLAQFTEAPKGRAALTAAAARNEVAAALTARNVLIQVQTKTGPVFVESGTGTIDNLSPGQAGGNGVLISQQNSVIFYETIVNDVYAWYLTGRKTQGGIAPFYVNNSPTTYGLFPTTNTDLATIMNFSQANGGPSVFPDSQALAIEAKLSWVDASTLPNGAQGYITAQANIPVYNKSNPTNWTPAGSKIATVALVGVHVVGSAAGHPEMIWATFEHQDNTPLATFQYSSGNQTVTVNQNTSTNNWLFSAKGAGAPFNGELAKYAAPNIVATSSANTIAPSNVLRWKAWGSASDGIPNQNDPTPAAANTEIISLDTNVQSQLNAAGASSDPRYGYLLIGATWTFGGTQPSGPYPTNPIPNGTGANEIGTSMLANSTMETFQQGTNSTFGTAASLNGTNCFTCHSDYGTNTAVKASTLVSHIFPTTNPLPLSTLKKGK